MRILGQMTMETLTLKAITVSLGVAGMGPSTVGTLPTPRYPLLDPWALEAPDGAIFLLVVTKILSQPQHGQACGREEGGRKANYK